MFTIRRILPALCALAILAACMFPSHEAGAGFSLREKLGKRKAERTPPHAPLERDSFAAGFKVSGREGAILSMELPAEVYSRLIRDDFRDICVFDAAGTPVPFTLASPRDDRQNASASVEAIPFFPWPEEKPKLPPSVTHSPSGMDVEIDTKGGIIRIRGQADGQTLHPSTGSAEGQTDGGAPPLPQAAPVTPPDRILLDMESFLNAVPQSFTRKELRTARLLLRTRDNRSVVSSVTLSGSDDLSSWRSLQSPQPLVRLAQGEHTVERMDIDLPVPCPRYLLLRFTKDVPEILAVSGKAEYGRRVATTRETLLSGTLAKDGRSAEYTLTGAYPLYAINFISKQADFMPFRLDVASPVSEKHWRPLLTGVIYNFEKDGVTVSNSPFPLTRISGKHLRLGGTWEVPFVSAPDLLIAWRPHTLTFLARGQGPWTIAYGRTEPVQTSPFLPGEFDAGEPAHILPGSNATDRPESGKMETMETTDAGLPAGQGEESSSAAILWAALGLAVVVLSGIAVYLFRNS